MTIFDRDFRLLVIGAQGVGKTCLIRCFSNCIENEQGVTILHLDEQKIRISVTEKEKWQKEFSNDFDAVAILFSTDDFDTYEYTISLIKEIRNSDYIPVVIIENKIDLLEQGEVEKKTVEAMLRELRLRLYRVSALKEFNVMHPFAYLLEKLTRTRDENWNHAKQIDQHARLPSREGWGEPVKQRKKEKCSLM